MDDFSTYLLSTSLGPSAAPRNDNAGASSAPNEAESSTHPNEASPSDLAQDPLMQLLTPSADWYTKDISEFKEQVHVDQLLAILRRQSDKLPLYSAQDLQQLAHTVSKDASKSADFVIKGLTRIKDAVQSQGHRVGQLLEEPSRSAPETDAAPSPTAAPASQSLSGLLTKFNANTWQQSLKQTESTVSRWGLNLTHFIQDAITIEPSAEASANPIDTRGSAPTGTATDRLSPKRHAAAHRQQKRLQCLQIDRNTYLVDPSAASDSATAATFATFCAHFSRDEHASAIEALLQNHPEVQVLYKELVPDQVTAAEFWCRYYFRVQELDAQEQARAQLLERKSTATIDPSHSACSEATPGSDFGWSSEEDDGGTDRPAVPSPSPVIQDPTRQTPSPTIQSLSSSDSLKNAAESHASSPPAAKKMPQRDNTDDEESWGNWE
ncbi:hypothetical protein H4R34_001421 [Dimargaris verticillata]|uniref:BSD domain-containing protein n=1 Tax=Dimargaris verticillata TaxID=2761393 RepID=A0A9W8EAY7_9FUNG|nr:hypothetical protein H4R34_001421 [Dimargaris verticillata]